MLCPPQIRSSKGTLVDSWALTRHDIEVAIKRSGNTMAGPDRLPYEAWRQLGDTAVDALFEAGLAMQQPDFPTQIRAACGFFPHEPHPFNLGTLVCLPKKAVAHHGQHGEVYTPEGTRPLSIVDTANRILANSFRHRWEPLLSRWISPQQRGFLPGRSILANVVDVEEAALQSALAHDMPATFLFDFSAAFPSVNQEYVPRPRPLPHRTPPSSSLRCQRSVRQQSLQTGLCWGPMGGI